MKKNLGLLFGGRSCEHEVSVISARSILSAIDRDQYNVTLIGIDKTGHWHLTPTLDHLLTDGTVTPTIGTTDDTITLALHHQGNLTPAPPTPTPTPPPLPNLDIIFPALHGTFGEDGTIQGVFEMAGIPYVGCGVAASAIAMDKPLAKKIFTAAGLPHTPYLDFTAPHWHHSPTALITRIETELGYPLFIKPANLGSSIGISKATTRPQLQTAIQLAFHYDTKIIIEQAMQNCLEVECAILGNHAPEASVVGTIIPGADFYDYTTKYIHDTAQLIVPADLPSATTKKIQDLAITAFKEIGATGLARVDFFVHRHTGQITLNEINTMPGFTPISMYPRLWAATGLSYPDLIHRLIALALETHHSKSTLTRSVTPPQLPRV